MPSSAFCGVRGAFDHAEDEILRRFRQLMKAADELLFLSCKRGGFMFGHINICCSAEKSAACYMEIVGDTIDSRFRWFCLMIYPFRNRVFRISYPVGKDRLG